MAIQLGKKEEQVQYYYSIDSKQFGPYDLAVLLSKIDSNTLVWREGIEWTNASNVEELKKFFNISADVVVEPDVQYANTLVTEDTASASPKKMFAAPFSFDGRIRRKEYGISVIIFYFLYVGIASALLQGRISSGFMGVLYIPLIWFMLAQGAKRCHDRNNSGWYQIIPFYGLWMLFSDGDSQTNNFGNSPK